MIREATSPDVPWLVQAIGRCFAEVKVLTARGFSFDHRSTGGFLLGLLLSGEGKIWIAELDGQPVGLRVARRYWYPYNRAIMIVAGLIWYVDPVARGLGIGQHLYACIETWAREQRATFLTAQPVVYAHGVRGFFEEHGYQLFEEFLIKEVRHDR